jgi:hypothetical protein
MGCLSVYQVFSDFSPPSGAAQLLQSNRPGDRAAAEGGICTEEKWLLRATSGQHKTTKDNTHIVY